MAYIDTYVLAFDRGVLEAFCAAQDNVIGPVQGRAATEEMVDADGAVIPARAAVGDPLCFYACVRSLTPIALGEGVSFCVAEVGQSVLGAWA